MADQPRLEHYEISTPDGHPSDSRITVDGREVKNADRLTLELDATTWARLEVALTAVEVTAQGEAVVSYLFGGERFTSADVDTLLQPAPDQAAVRDIAIRLASAMGILGVGVDDGAV